MLSYHKPHKPLILLFNFIHYLTYIQIDWRLSSLIYSNVKIILSHKVYYILFKFNGASKDESEMLS